MLVLTEEVHTVPGKSQCSRSHLFAAQHDAQDVGLHNTDEVRIRALGQRLVLVRIAASIVYPAAEMDLTLCGLVNRPR